MYVCMDARRYICMHACMQVCMYVKCYLLPLRYLGFRLYADALLKWAEGRSIGKQESAMNYGRCVNCLCRKQR